MITKRMAAAVAAASVAAGMTSAIAGCGVFHAVAPAGMEQQIVKGEQVSAATRAHSAAAARSSASPAKSTAAVPATSAIPGSEVTAIGDSVMAASAPALESALPGVYIDAQPDREWAAGLDVVRGLVTSGRLRPIVVVGLGTNYIVTTAQLNELLRLIGPERKLVLVNTYVPDSWSKEVNATEAAFVARHRWIVLADWYDLIRTRTYLLWPDQVHPEIPGTIVYARMVYQAIQATRGAVPQRAKTTAIG